MDDHFYVGRRLSYEGHLCTVRYVGTLPGKGDWLGVEWDDSTKGKHDGSYAGIRYFCCQDRSPTAGSFLRLSRPHDSCLSFVGALRHKYASAEAIQDSLGRDLIQISGKTVEEVGFQKIQDKLKKLPELRIVILDGFRIAGVDRRPWSLATTLTSSFQESLNFLHSWNLCIEELNLSRNLLESWADVVLICKSLKSLRSLVLNGNRFRDLRLPPLDEESSSSHNVKVLALDYTFLEWREVVHMISVFPSLASFSLSHNLLRDLTAPIKKDKLTELDLSYNQSLGTLAQLSPLSHLPCLKKLSLRGNPITSLRCPTDLSFPTLDDLDLSSIQLASFDCLDAIPRVFPTLTSLLTKDTPLAKLPSAPLHTIARIATLKALNFSAVTPEERQEAELYYRNFVVRELATAITQLDEWRILQHHSRWAQICEIHGMPDIPRERDKSAAAAGTLAARVTEFTFIVESVTLRELQAQKIGADHIPQKQSIFPLRPTETSRIIHKTKYIPRTVSIYRLIGIVERLFSVSRPLSCKLILETDEYDPLNDEDDDEQSVSGGNIDGSEAMDMNRKGTWARREEELIEGTKPVRDWVNAPKARVRIEMKSMNVCR